MEMLIVDRSKAQRASPTQFLYELNGLGPRKPNCFLALASFFYDQAHEKLWANGPSSQALPILIALTITNYFERKKNYSLQSPVS